VSKIIRLTESDLITTIENILLKKPKHFSSGKNLLEFAKKLYEWDYTHNGNRIDVETQNNFVRDILPKRKSVIKEYNNRFNNSLILESKKDINYIGDFFNFLIENSIPLNESATADQILQGLHKAFDGVGTDENLAVNTILKIKSKDVLTQLDQKIRSTVGKKYPKIQSLSAWINDEMSEIDPTQYDKLWGHLTKMGYKGKESNKFLRAVGKGKEAVASAWDWTKKSVIGKFFNMLRDALNSGIGIATQLVLDALGPATLGIGFAIPMLLWGILVSWDFVNLLSGEPEWLNLIFDSLGLISAGAMSAVLKPFTSAAKGASFSSIEKVFAWLSKTSFGKAIAGWMPKLQSLAGKAGNGLVNTAEWIGTKLSGIFGKGFANTLKTGATKAQGWMTGFVDSMAKWFSGAGSFAKKEASTVAKAAAHEGGKKLSEKTAKFLTDKVAQMFSSKSWLQGEVGLRFLEKGLKPATAKLASDYAIKPLREKGVHYASELVDKKYGPIYGDTIRFTNLAHATGSEGKELLHNLKSFKNVESLEKGAHLRQTVGTAAGAYKEGGEGYEKGESLYKGAVEGVRQGGPKDKNQYKQYGNKFYYAPKESENPKWIPVTNPNAKNYIAKYIFPDILRDIPKQPNANTTGNNRPNLNVA
jgi:hypothetical protein